MGFKDLLVYIDGGKASDQRVAAAIALAQRYDAHLTGLVVAIEPHVPGFVVAQMPASAWDAQLAVRREQAKSVAAKFRSAAERGGLTVECRIETAPELDLARSIGVHARHADLTILGQSDPDDGPGGVGLIGDVLLGSGRPVLAVPYIGAGPTLGERIVVAWDGGREAARAVNDAMPFLTRAKSVSVVVFNASSRADRHGSVAGADIALHLARHGVKVAAEALEVHDISVGEALLSRLADESADLLVMGGYGHSRLRQTVLGGVTRTVLSSMTVPVFLSH